MIPLFTITFFFLMIRRPPRSTLDRSSAASDVYKRQAMFYPDDNTQAILATEMGIFETSLINGASTNWVSVSYTHLRAHETVLDLVCRLLLEKKKNTRLTTHNQVRVNYKKNRSNMQSLVLRIHHTHYTQT